MSELKPCPLCWGEVEVYNPMPGYNGGYGIYCPTCDSYFQHGDSDKEAAEAWNSRAYDIGYLKEWAFKNMECCDEPEFLLFTAIYKAATIYLKEVEK